MNQYYSDTLSARNLERCYEIAPVRIRQYLDAEIDFVKSVLTSYDKVVELGCGYGRVLGKFQEVTPNAVGVDTSFGNLLYGKPWGSLHRSSRAVFGEYFSPGCRPPRRHLHCICQWGTGGRVLLPWITNTQLRKTAR